MEKEDILQRNIIRQYELNQQIKTLSKEKDTLATESLDIMQCSGLKKFVHNNLLMSVQSNKKKVGVNENILASLISPADVQLLKIVPVEAITSGLKNKTLPAAAKEAIITIDSAEFVTVKSLSDKEEAPRSL